MSRVILLGAGASVEAGVPDTYQMTEVIAKRFREDSSLQKNSEVITFVIGGLLFQKGIDGKDPFSGINVEELFNAVQLLAERRSLEAAPFVGSWHASVERFDKAVLPQTDQVYRLILENITKGIFDSFPKETSSSEERAIEEALRKSIAHMLKDRSPWGPSDGVGYGVKKYLSWLVEKWRSNIKSGRSTNNTEFDQQFTVAIDQLLENPGEGEIFRKTADLMIKTLTDIVWIEDESKVDYLLPLLDLRTRDEKMVIATLNYDNGIEILCKKNNLEYTTGIQEWSESGNFEFKDGICLLKLHGSIDWTLRNKGHVISHKTIEQLTSDDIKTKTSFYGMQSRYRPAVIFGQSNKLTAEGPFLDLLRSFKMELEKANELFVIGYSFRDIHINEYISQWLNHDKTNTMKIVDPYFETNKSKYVNKLREFKYYNSERIEVIQSEASKALKEL